MSEENLEKLPSDPETNQEKKLKLGDLEVEEGDVIGRKGIIEVRRLKEREEKNLEKNRRKLERKEKEIKELVEKKLTEEEIKLGKGNPEYLIFRADLEKGVIVDEDIEALLAEAIDRKDEEDIVLAKVLLEKIKNGEIKIGKQKIPTETEAKEEISKSTKEVATPATPAELEDLDISEAEKLFPEESSGKEKEKSPEGEEIDKLKKEIAQAEEDLEKPGFLPIKIQKLKELKSRLQELEERKAGRGAKEFMEKEVTNLNEFKVLIFKMRDYYQKLPQVLNASGKKEPEIYQEEMVSEFNKIFYREKVKNLEKIPKDKIEAARDNLYIKSRARASLYPQVLEEIKKIKEENWQEDTQEKLLELIEKKTKDETIKNTKELEKERLFRLREKSDYLKKKFPDEKSLNQEVIRQTKIYLIEQLYSLGGLYGRTGESLDLGTLVKEVKEKINELVTIKKEEVPLEKEKAKIKVKKEEIPKEKEISIEEQKRKRIEEWYNEKTGELFQKYKNKLLELIKSQEAYKDLSPELQEQLALEWTKKDTKRIKRELLEEL